MIRGIVVNIDGTIEEKDCDGSNPASNTPNVGWDFKVLHIFEYGQKKIYIFGSTRGPRELINHYEMPHPMDAYLQYGDLLILSQFNGRVCSLYEREWLDCYEEQFEGFEDLDYNPEDDEESIGDYDYTDPFLVDDRDGDGDVIMT